MRFKNLAIAMGAVGLVATPLVAQAADAPLARSGAAIGDAEDIAGGGSIIIALLALAAVVGGIIIAVEDGNEPTSP